MTKLIINRWDRYWKITILYEVESIKYLRYVQGKCDCGVIKKMALWNLRSWKIISCWCHKIKIKTTHWLSKTRIYHIWQSMKNRCSNTNATCYKDWWGRWINVCIRWLNGFEYFYEDMIKWYSDNLSIDRIDNNKWYYKENCRWATQKEQARNTRKNIIYKWKCISEWCEELWLNRNTVWTKLQRNTTINKALWFEEKSTYKNI